MLNWFARRMKEARDDEQGFTLIELLVVVIIIGILLAIAVPVYLNQRQGAQDRAAQSNVRSAAQAQQAFRTGNNGYATTIGALSSFGFNNSTDVPVTFTGTPNATTFCVTAMSQSGQPFSMGQAQGQPVSNNNCT